MHALVAVSCLPSQRRNTSEPPPLDHAWAQGATASIALATAPAPPPGPLDRLPLALAESATRALRGDPEEAVPDELLELPLLVHEQVEVDVLRAALELRNASDHLVQRQGLLPVAHDAEQQVNVLLPRGELHGRQPVPQHAVLEDAPELAEVDVPVPRQVHGVGQVLHLLRVDPRAPLRPPQHELVVLLGHPEGLLDEDTVDDVDYREANDALVDEGNVDKPEAHVLVEHPGDRRPVPERELEH
eukprot:CAMPEP_0179319406 /NCGR_PEP_ID=MMETSP0797-20121207/57466_1 /TAXON_ID=47934 /ORGANISM="Dinophysis acuminata, Strain DAEP01" /LENGTH=243 /DNA_ID=CAMNT_0021030771 /DNA_START=122 /DNA_END=854 /DNA_ORIENTATION=+